MRTSASARPRPRPIDGADERDRASTSTGRAAGPDDADGPAGQRRRTPARRRPAPSRWHHRDHAHAADVAADPVIRVGGLRKRYGDVGAVDGIDFEVAPRRGLRAARAQRRRQDDDRRDPRGPARARRRRGRRVLGLDVAAGADALKPRIGVSLQTAALYPKLTVAEVIDLFRELLPERPRRPSELDRRCWSSASGATPGRRTCRAASGSACRSPSRSSTTRSSSSSTSRRRARPGGPALALGRRPRASRPTAGRSS